MDFSFVDANPLMVGVVCLLLLVFVSNWGYRLYRFVRHGPVHHGVAWTGSGGFDAWFDDLGMQLLYLKDRILRVAGAVLLLLMAAGAAYLAYLLARAAGIVAGG